MRYWIVLFLFCLGIGPAVQAQNKGVVKGRVFDLASNEAIPFANVVVYGTTLGGATDEEGRFRLENVPPGLVRLEVSSIGYQTLVTVGFLLGTAGERTENIGLEPASTTLEQVVVKASPYRKTVETPVSIQRIGIAEIENVSLAVVRQFSRFMSERWKKGSYINGLLKVAKAFIQYCYEEGYGGFNTRKNFKWCKQDKAVILAFSVADVRQMLRSCKGCDFMQIRDAAILTMLFETGIRCWELCCIQKQDIHDDFIIINGKNHKQRVVPITPVLRKAMLRYEQCAAQYFTLKNTEDFYFLSFHGRQLTNSAVEHIIKRHGEGIEGVRVSPHTCRHFYAQQQIKMGTDLYTISRLLGHENVQITQTYLNSLRDADVIQIAKQKSVLMSM
mgnify:CR=1 FL=1